VRDEEEHLDAAQQDRLDGEEVAGDDAGRLGPQELAPARTAASRRRCPSGPREQPPDASRRHREAELPKLAVDPPVGPADSPGPAAAPAPESPPTALAYLPGHPAAATYGAPRPDANAAPCGASPTARCVTTAADARQRRSAAPDRRRGASAAPPVGVRHQAHAAAPAVRRLLRRGRDGCEQAHPAAPERRDKGTRGTMAPILPVVEPGSSDTDIGTLHGPRHRRRCLDDRSRSSQRRQVLPRKRCSPARSSQSLAYGRGAEPAAFEFLGPSGCARQSEWTRSRHASPSGFHFRPHRGATALPRSTDGPARRAPADRTPATAQRQALALPQWFVETRLVRPLP
jgi:hypothetical protein